MIDSLGSSARRSAWRPIDHRRRRTSADTAQVHARRRHAGASPTTAATSMPGSRRASAASRSAAARRSATTRTRRRRPPRSSMIDGVRYSIPGDYADGRRRRHGHAARARQPVHQHRRREGVPRGGRGGAQAAPDGRTTRPSSACPTSASARRSPRSSSRTPAATLDEAALIAHVKEHLAALQGAQAGAHRSTPSAGPPTASSTTSAAERRRRRQLGRRLTRSARRMRRVPRTFAAA